MIRRSISSQRTQSLSLKVGHITTKASLQEILDIERSIKHLLCDTIWSRRNIQMATARPRPTKISFRWFDLMLKTNAYNSWCIGQYSIEGWQRLLMLNTLAYYLYRIGFNPSHINTALNSSCYQSNGEIRWQPSYG